jgi:DHA1 family quinolone resistance protein-like MFS transporter
MGLRRYNSSLTVLYVATGVVQASMNIVFLALPLYALAIAASPFEIGVLGAVGGLTYSVMARFLGSLSDRLSKKSFIILGTVLQAASSLLYPTCERPPQLILVRVVQSFGLALFWPPIEALVASNARTDSLERALTGYNISWGAASAVGSPLAGFLITAFSLAVPFYASAAVALLVSISLLALLKKTEDDPPTKELETIPAVERSKPSTSFMPMASAFAFAFISGIVYTLFPVFATQLGIPAYQMGLLFLVSSIVQTLVFVASERLLHRFAMKSFLIGLAAFTISLVLIAAVENVMAFTFSFIGLGLGQGILYSASLYYLLRGSDRNRGHATGRFESNLGFASFLGPLLGGAVAQFNPSFPYAAGALVSFLTLVVQLFFTMKT